MILSSWRQMEIVVTNICHQNRNRKKVAQMVDYTF